MLRFRGARLQNALRRGHVENLVAASSRAQMRNEGDGQLCQQCSLLCVLLLVENAGSECSQNRSCPRKEKRPGS